MFEIYNEFKEANIPRTIRFTQNLFDELNCISNENNISFNLLVLQCCRYAIDNQKKDDTLPNQDQK